MLKNCGFLIVLISIVFLGCGEDEEDEFTSSVETNVTIEDVSGTWFVFAGEFMDNFVEVTPNFPDCGNDHIIFGQNGEYKEVLYNKFDCIPRVTTASWKIENGIIIVSTSNETVEFPVIEASSNELVINFRYDFDNDGTQDVFKAYLRPYDVLENYHISKSFQRNSQEESLLQFNWEQETNTSSFSSYEIYRSQEGSCSKENAVRIAEINTITETSFIDHNPPPTQGSLCYFLRVYSNGALVGESKLLSENPRNLVIPTMVELKKPVVEGESIFLEWDEYDMPYFSHYQIVYANSDASNLLFHEEDAIAEISSVEQKSYLAIDPPYLENPFLAVYAYNIFGTKVVSNYEQVTFRRSDLVGPIYLEHIEIDDDEPIVYFYGPSKIPAWAEYNQSAVLRYNYESGAIESYTNEETGFSYRNPFKKPISFTEGRELVVNATTNLHFHDPAALVEKFSFDTFYLSEGFNLFRIIDFAYTKDGFLVLMDSDNVFVFQRDGETLTLLDKQIHYTTHHGDENYRMLEINENQVLVGHKAEQESILFEIDGEGQLQNKTIVSLPLDSEYIPNYKNVSFYSDSANVLINYGQKSLYSTLSFEPEIELPQDLFALGLSNDGSFIFSSYNDPDWYGSDIQTEFLKREVVLFDTETGAETSIGIKGYPIRIFENSTGEVFSISIPENQVITQFDVFVEKIEMP